MTKIICASVDCKYNNDKNVCTAKKVSMSWQSVMTVYEGRQEYLRCNQYEMDEFSKQIHEEMQKYMKLKVGRERNHGN